MENEQLNMFPKTEKMVKVGYVRLVSNNYKDSFVSFRELSYYSDAQINALKSAIESGQKRMYCACCPYDDLELQITQNGVVRVKNNGQQDKHMDSCPKSIRYGVWLKESVPGTSFYKDNEKIIFNITLPGVGGGSVVSSSSPTSASNSDPKTSVLELAKVLDCVAWEKQTYSKKKAMGIANKNGEPCDFQYKDIQKFCHLVFGISNDIYVSIRGSLSTFNSLFYSYDEFWSCRDYKRRFFFFAEIEKVSEYKPERKYQYVTVKMPSNKSKSKCTIRIPTDKYEKIFEDIDENNENITRMLAGYINHSVFRDSDGTITEWATLLKGVGFYVSKNGLYAETQYVAEIIDDLCSDMNLIIRRPYLPLENFQNFIPTLIVERHRHKDILIDIVDGEKAYNKHARGAEGNSEYDCIILREGEAVDILSKIQEYM